VTAVADVTDQVHADATHGDLSTVLPPPPGARGQTTVAPAVVERIAQRAAGEVTGVRAERVSTLRSWFGGGEGPAGGPAVSSESELHGAHAEIHLTLGVEWPRSVIDTVREVQRHVARQVERFTGVHVCRVDVDVTDLPARPAPMRVQ
jgi:uncharacterized alkaline shock family protein YloU